MNSQSSNTRRQWLQFPLFFLFSILGGIVSHNLVAYFSVPHNTALPASSRLEVRNDVVERGLGDFFSSLGTGFENAVGSLLPNISSVLDSLTGGVNGSSIVDSLAEPAKYLGVGLSEGALTGLNMSTANMTAPSGIDNVAQNLGSGLTSAIFSSSSIKALLNFNGSSLGSSGTVGQAALALAQGLGGGAASGLQVKSKVIASMNMSDVSFNKSGINGVVGNFGQGLSSSLLSAVQLPSLSSLMSTGGSILGGSGTSSLNIAAIGNGLGAGLGQGAAIGLGFQANVATTSTQDAAGITQDFARGLASSFLQNGTLTAVTKSLSASSSDNSSVLGGLSLSNIDIAKAAEGLAVGLVSGVGSTISTLQIIDADTTSFNDSVGGAATGFGRGLGTEGGKLVEQLLASSSSKAASRKRSLDLNIGDMSERSLSLIKRDTATVNATDLASVLANLNASNINPLLQTGINALTCDGVGGLAGIFLGLVQSKTININSLTSKVTSTGNSSLSLPDQTFIIKSGGNTYSLNPAQGIMSVFINGMRLGSFIGVAAAHIIFAIITYFVAIPLLMILVNTEKLTTQLGKPQPRWLSPKWQTYLAYSIIPLSVLTFIMGVVFGTGRKHFASVHEILGLLVFVQTLIAACTTILLRRQGLEMVSAKKLTLVHYVNIAIMLFLTFLTLLFGFADLSSVALCITQSIVPISVWMALGWLLLTPFMAAITLQAMVFLLNKMRRSEAVVVKKENIVKVKGGEVKGSYLDV